MKKKNQNKNSTKHNRKYGGAVSPYQQWFGPKSQAPKPQHNAGLYTGPSFDGPWGNIPVTPTTTNMINQNLRSANPPPGATTQYPGNIRPGNNWQAMVGVDRFISDNKVNWGPFKINCTANKLNGGSYKKSNKKQTSKSLKKK